jgi:hypothetical protein
LKPRVVEPPGVFALGEEAKGWNVDFVYKGTTRELSARDNCNSVLDRCRNVLGGERLRRKGANVVGVHLSREAEAPTDLPQVAALCDPFAHKRTRLVPSSALVEAFQECR